jgi:hypothetical protein
MRKTLLITAILATLGIHAETSVSEIFNYFKSTADIAADHFTNSTAHANLFAGKVSTTDPRVVNGVTNNATATLNLSSGSTVATATSGSEPVTLDQALSLLASTTDLYLSPTVFTGAQVATTNRSLASMFSPTAWSVVYSGTVTAGQYLFSFTAPSNLVTAVQSGTQEADIYMTYAGGGGSTLTCKLEGYIFNPATTSSVDYAETSASFAVTKSATLPTSPQRLTAIIPYATNLVGNARYQIRVKAITASSVTSVTMWGGSNTISFIKLPVAKDVAVGTRGALAIESADGVQGTYDSTTRKLTMPENRYLSSISTNVTTTEFTADASLASKFLITAESDITMAVTNAVDGQAIKWRVYASGADRTITWPVGQFVIPNSSSMPPSVVITNGTYSVFVTEYAAPTTNSLLQAYIWGYAQPQPPQ